MFEDIVTCLPVFYKFIYHKNDEGSALVIFMILSLCP